MKTRTPEDRMMQAVFTLSTAKPYIRTDDRYSVDEFRVYQEGYYCALAQALRALDSIMSSRRQRPARPHKIDIDRKAG